MSAELYLGPELSGIAWLLDPTSLRLAELAGQFATRTEESPCEPEAVATDLADLPGLLRERHFGVATGIVPQDAAAEAERLIASASERIRRLQPSVWGEAIGDLNDQLRTCLHDRHVRLGGAPATQIRADEPAADVDQSAAAAEVELRHGVLCVTVRRFWGNASDDQRLWEWAGQSAEHFQHQRIIVDLRGNTGGNDAVMWEWMRPVLSAGTTVPGTAIGWYVGDSPLGIWNSAALIEARDGRDAVPKWHLENRHTPTPGDRLSVRAEDGDEEVPAGVRPWHGRMLVLVDGRTQSSGESSAWMLQHGLGARVIGRRTAGMIEYGNVVPYFLPASGLHVGLPTKRNNFGIPVELVGFPVHADLDPTTPLEVVGRDFGALYEA